VPLHHVYLFYAATLVFDELNYRLENGLNSFAAYVYVFLWFENLATYFVGLRYLKGKCSIGLRLVKRRAQLNYEAEEIPAIKKGPQLSK